MNCDIVGESLGELEAVFFAAVNKILVKCEIVFVEFLDLARFDV